MGMKLFNRVSKHNKQHKQHKRTAKNLWHMAKVATTELHDVTDTIIRRSYAVAAPLIFALVLVWNTWWPEDGQLFIFEELTSKQVTAGVLTLLGVCLFQLLHGCLSYIMHVHYGAKFGLDSAKISEQVQQTFSFMLATKLQVEKRSIANKDFCCPVHPVSNPAVEPSPVLQFWRTVLVLSSVNMIGIACIRHGGMDLSFEFAWWRPESKPARWEFLPELTDSAAAFEAKIPPSAVLVHNIYKRIAAVDPLSNPTLVVYPEIKSLHRCM